MERVSRKFHRVRISLLTKAATDRWHYVTRTRPSLLKQTAQRRSQRRISRLYHPQRKGVVATLRLKSALASSGCDSVRLDFQVSGLSLRCSSIKVPRDLSLVSLWSALGSRWSRCPPYYVVDFVKWHECREETWFISRADINWKRRGNKALRAGNDGWFIYTFRPACTRFSSGILTPFGTPRDLDLFREKSWTFPLSTLLSRRYVYSGAFRSFSVNSYSRNGIGFDK